MKIRPRSNGTDMHLLNKSSNPFAWVLTSMIDKEQYTSQVRQLVKDGVWCVPPAERPKGWEKLGVRESDQND